MKAQEIQQRLRQSGCRMTPQRRLIIDTLLRAPEPLTAQQVYETVAASFPNISFDTVYRNLGLLNRLGVVNRINLKVRFNSRFEIADGHRHHFVCLECGSSFPINFCPFEQFVPKIPPESGFRVVDHAFEMYGYCAQCQEEPAN